MPVPEGVISTSAIWQAPVEEVVEDSTTLDEAIAEADAEEATEEYQDDLPELP